MTGRWYTVIQEEGQNVVVMNRDVHTYALFAVLSGAYYGDELKAIAFGNMVVDALNSDPKYTDRARAIVGGA